MKEGLFPIRKFLIHGSNQSLSMLIAINVKAINGSQKIETNPIEFVNRQINNKSGFGRAKPKKSGLIKSFGKRNEF